MQLHPRFEKSRSCPTNESLLAFLQAKPNLAPDEEARHIIEHLASCEFCELALELLRAYPEPPATAPPAIPPPPEAMFRLFTTQREPK